MLQVLVSLDRRPMIAVFPECAVASFPLMVFLPTAAGDQLHAISDNIWTGVFDDEITGRLGCVNTSERHHKHYRETD